MGKVMRGRVSKWGNSLALRLPAEYVKATGLRVGDSVELEATARGELRIVPSKPFDMEAFLAGLRKSRASMPITESVVEQMRRDARY
ncbi:MAG: AbrB/MazE/SpoVT family DNA-binding domain-containing protein [Betaproteobacteria bacterium]|nr:AbrB/MazE/SpoVT family DNA-binding domain-containing protein [Betaproteobacteria bacterium]